MLRNKLKRFSIAVAAMFVMMFSLLPVSAFADVEVATRRDDVYNQLFAAATVNVLANTLKKCIPSIVGPGVNSGALELFDPYGITSSEVRSGSVFTTGVFGVATKVTTALWVENATQGKSDNGSIYCHQEDGTNILIQFVKAINEISGTNVGVTDLMCNGGTHRLVQRGAKTVTYSGMIGDTGTYTYSLADDRNCNSFTDSDGIWLRADDAATQFKNYYNTWRANNVAKNPFLPTYDELGKFNNVDGYFTYLEDFNQHCRAAAGIKASDRESATDYYGVTKYSKDDRKITARKLYYHLSSNKTWESPLSEDHPVKTCGGLLERVEALRTTSNGLPINGRTGGYENILLAELDSACKNAKTSEGNNGWAELKTKLTEVINDPDATDEAKEKAQENLDKLNDVVNNNKYIEASGSEDSDDGKVYQCVSIDGLDIDVDDYNVPSVVPDPGTTEPTTTDPNDGEAVCKANAGVLGWILCPIIKAISGIGEHMWNQVEQNHLKIQAREMFVNNTGVKDAFDVVRNISNIAFIILFMFVIFSQLTGVGIDNYGIKRILPRLIMVAILTNLSYYICEAAVDVSNIFGAGLNDMLTGFANNIGYGNDSMGALAGGLAIDALLTGGGVAVFLTLNPMGAVGGAIWIAFAVLGVIISMVAAMLVLYLIVVIREAAIIIMVVLAPVAIVCYALPNTEKIYKRWFDIFKALLIVYPICGAMVGAGRLAAAVLGQINTQSMAIAAMIVQVIPFFLIPMLLKNSLAALGNIGAKISNAGRSLSRRASGAVTSGIRNSARFKDFEQFQKDKTTAERAKKIAEGRLGSKIDALRSKGENNLSKSEKSRLRRYESRMARANAVLREDDRRSLENQIGSIQSVQDAELAKQRLGIQESTADTLLYGNDDFIAAQEQKGDNSRRDRLAEAEVGVLELDRDLARNRAQSRKDTQEYKAYQDQYAGYDRKRLTEDARSASTWMNQAGGAQRMSALLQALEANGLEKEMFDMLDKNDVSKMAGAAMVMQTLSGSKNKVAKAYGKKAIDTETGKTVSYREFMTGTGSQSMRAYMDGKGSSFADGLDDKALFQIRNMGTSMRTGELIDFASKLTDNDSIKEVNEMISAKIANGETFQMNGKQLSNMHDSTMIRMLAGQNGRDALLAASDDLSPELLANTDATVKIRLNALRSANNKPPLGTPQTPPKPQGESFNDGGGI